MGKKPLVSVIVVNFNFETFAVQTLQSISSQTFTDFELIVIDDCSTDRSLTQIRTWLDDYPGPAQLLVNKQNKGVCATLNIAFAAAQGKYIAATAADDLWLPQKLQTQVGIMEASDPEVCLVYSDAYLIKEDGTDMGKRFLGIRNVQGYPQGDIFNHLLVDNFIPAMSVLLRKDCFQQVGPFDEKLSYEDYDMWLRLARKFQFKFDPYVSCKYRIKAKSLSTTILWNLPNAKILLKHLDHNPLVLKTLRELALRAYKKKEKKVFDVFSSAGLQDKYINRLGFLIRLKIPAWLGKKLLPRTSL